MSPMGPRFLNLGSFTTKCEPFPQASHCAPAPFFVEKYFCFTFTAAFTPFCLIFCAAAWLSEEGSCMCQLLDWGGWFLRQLLVQVLAFADVH